MWDNKRLDLETIVDLVPAGAHVLDLGCGDGTLLRRLVDEKHVEARGVELSEENARAAITHGLPVRHGNIEDGLADYSDRAFDYVVLSQTLAYLDQPTPVVTEMLRVGRYAVISFFNAGCWRARLRMLFGKGFGSGLSSGEPRERSITLDHFESFCGKLGARIEKTVFLSGRRVIRTLPRFRSCVAVYVISTG